MFYSTALYTSAHMLHQSVGIYGDKVCIIVLYTSGGPFEDKRQCRQSAVTNKVFAILQIPCLPGLQL